MGYRVWVLWYVRFGWLGFPEIGSWTLPNLASRPGTNETLRSSRFRIALIRWWLRIGQGIMEVARQETSNSEERP